MRSHLVRRHALSVVLTAVAGVSIGCAAKPEYQPKPRSESTRFPQRLDSISFAYLGTPYRLGPLGEGDSALGDARPRFRTDSFDCVTYIETMEALARAESPDSVLPVLDRIRYDRGQVRWEHRNHFTEADWLPANTAAGHLALDTAESDSLDRRTLSRGAFYASHGAVRPDTTVLLPLLTRARIQELFSVPSRSNRIRGIGLVGRIPGYAILHTGFLVERPGQLPLLRHASQAGTVREQPLAEYLASKPKFVGVVLWSYRP